jgi:uncharacterized protein (DUF1800 family)
MKTPAMLNGMDEETREMIAEMGDMQGMKRKDLSPDQKKDFGKASYRCTRNLNLAWMNEMVDSPAQLREKMSLFWHGHFATRVDNIFFTQSLLDIIRRNALGNFGDLLHALSKSGAMINFLNSNQNKKDHPNENFAREVMELFTLGRGNYTETDVKEAARAFTGWGADLQGNFVFRSNQHDTRDKTVLGRSGNFDGDDVLNILLEQKQTARFVTRKIYRFLVNEQPDEAKVDWLAGRFYKNNYEIKPLMEDIFLGDWFYEEKNIGSRIKSPVELIAGIRRMIPMKIANEESQLQVQAVLGQTLFFPPNVAGWPGGMNWIDSSSLMFRLRLPEIIYASGEIDLTAKPDDDIQMGRRELMEYQISMGELHKYAAQMIRAELFWPDYLKRFEQTKKEDLLSEIGKTILQVPTGIKESTIKSFMDVSGRESFIKTATIQLMSTPEYQLC